VVLDLLAHWVPPAFLVKVDPLVRRAKQALRELQVDLAAQDQLVLLDPRVKQDVRVTLEIQVSQVELDPLVSWE